MLPNNPSDFRVKLKTHLPLLGGGKALEQHAGCYQLRKLREFHLKMQLPHITGKAVPLILRGQLKILQINHAAHPQERWQTPQRLAQRFPNYGFE